MKDLLNRELKIGAWVATPVSGRAELNVGNVISIGEKMIAINAIDSGKIYMRYPQDVIILDDIKEFTLFLLAHETNHNG